MTGPFQQDIPWWTMVTGNVNESEGQSGLGLPLFSPAGLQSKLGPCVIDHDRARVTVL
jgi:hypothetical protein